jgi:hypothetical protein
LQLIQKRGKPPREGFLDWAMFNSQAPSDCFEQGVAVDIPPRNFEWVMHWSDLLVSMVADQPYD